MPYIGNQHNVGDHVNNFKVLDDISSHTATFDGSATSVIDTTNNTIRVPLHRFIQGQRVTYTNGSGGDIGGLTNNTAYFISFDSANTIKLATTLANANSNTVINLSAVGSGTSHTLNVAFDGVNTKFKMTHGSGVAARLNNATQINVAINNVIQRPNLDSNNFTDGFALEDNHKIVFKTAPTVNDIFWGSIIANTIENFDLRDNEVDNFTGDGSSTEFTLSTIPANNESVIVTIDGVLQHPSDKNTTRSYTLIDSIIQFTAAPSLNGEIQVRHIGFAGASTNDVSGFYGRTGNVALTSNDHITIGDIPTVRNINASGIITATTFDGAFSSSVGGSNANFTGIVTAGVFKGGDIEGRNLKITGLSTFVGDASFSGNVSIGGTLTYEDVTNIDSVGIITARDGIDCNADLDVDGHTNLDNVSVAGITTFATDVKLSEAEGKLEAIGSTGLTLNASGGSAFARIRTAGNERLRITSAGKVGINSTSPREKLDVIGNANIIVDNNKGIKLGHRGENKTAYIGLDANDAANAGSQSWANSAYIGFYSDGSSERSITYRTNVGSHIFQGTNGGEYVRISSTGLVGIGENNPSSIIHATGSNSSLGYQFINTHTTSGFGAFIKGGGTTTDRYALRVDNAAGDEIFRVNANKRVGIGTNNPGRLLTLFDNDQPVFQITNNTSGTANTRGSIFYQMSGTSTLAVDNQGTGSGGEIRFMSAGSNNVRIESNGNTVIGNATSGGWKAKVIVAANASYQSAVNITNNVNADINFEIKNSESKISSSVAAPLVFGTNATERLRITSGGCVFANNIGIGTDNRWKIRPNSSYTQLAFEYSTSTSLSDSNIKMILDPNGSLIVGGTSYGAAGTFSVAANGSFRQVLASGTAQNTLLNAISGVSNGFELTTDASNNQTYKFHNGSNANLTIDSSGRIKIGSISDHTQVATHSPVYIRMNTDITDVATAEGAANTGLVRIEETGSNALRYHGIELRNRQSGDIRLLNLDVNSSNYGDFVLALPSAAAGGSGQGLALKLRFNSISDAIQIAGKGGASLSNTNVEKTDIYIATKTGVTAVNTQAGDAVAGLIRFEDRGDSSNRYHGLELRNRNSGDARILNLDEGQTNKSNLVFATDDGSDIHERLRIESNGNALFTANQVKLYNATDNTNTYFYAQNTGAGNAGIKMKNSQGEWTIIANDRLRFIDDDAGLERVSITSTGKVGINNSVPQEVLNVKGTIATGRNVAREVGTIIDISSNYATSRGATNVINGSKNYEDYANNDWITANGARVNANFTLDLGAQYTCDRLVIYNQNEYSNNAREVKRFTFEGSNDKSSWTTLLDTECGASYAHEPNPGFSFRLPSNYVDDNEGVTYRYWRFTMKDFHGSTTLGGIMELELYEHAVGETTDDETTSEITSHAVVASDIYAQNIYHDLPAFFACRTSSLSISNQTNTVLAFTTTQGPGFDTRGYYDNNNYRFNPKIPGYYQINMCCSVSYGALQAGQIWIYKNGSPYALSQLYLNGGDSYDDICLNISALVHLNGQSDYVDARAWRNGGNGGLGSGAYDQHWSGYLVRHAGYRRHGDGV